MKLTPCVNFTNILQRAFLYKSGLLSLSLCTVWLGNFWQKNIGAKATCAIMVELNIHEWGTFYLFISKFFVTYNIGGAKELVVLL